MRTTFRLNQALLQQEARRVGIEAGRTLTAVFEDALREAIARRGKGPGSKKLRRPTSGRGGLRPGVDLDDSRSLLDAMDVC